MKKLLVLNGSHSDIPLIQAGKKLGYHVITTGNDPALLGHQYADEYHETDFSDVEAVYKLAKMLQVDAVCSCANDFGAITAAYVAEKMGLPGHDSYNTALILHHKDQFKDFSQKNNITTPLAQHFDKLEAALAIKNNMNFPVIIKPIDLTGGKGVTKVVDSDGFVKAVEKAFRMSRVGRVVIEEFIEGTQHSFSTFLVDQKVAAYFSDNEYSYLNPYLVSTSAGPAADIDKIKDRLIKEAEQIAALLGLVNGVFHLQYILRDGTPYILEITRRCSGDFYPQPVKHATNIDWATWIVKAECGEHCEKFPGKFEQQKYGGRHCIMGTRNGIVKNIIISDEIKSNIYDEFLWWHKGMEIENYMVEKMGVVFLEYKSEEEMLYKTNNITNFIYVEYEDTI